MSDQVAANTALDDSFASPTRQWPDNICGGPIRYGPATNYGGFYLADCQHGIPTIGAVPTPPDTIRGHRVDVFNYPGQTEAIARRLVAAWNACLSLSTEELERLVRGGDAKLSSTATPEAGHDMPQEPLGTGAE